MMDLSCLAPSPVLVVGVRLTFTASPLPSLASFIHQSSFAPNLLTETTFPTHDVRVPRARKLRTPFDLKIIRRDRVQRVRKPEILPYLARQSRSQRLLTRHRQMNLKPYTGIEVGEAEKRKSRRQDSLPTGERRGTVFLGKSRGLVFPAGGL